METIGVGIFVTKSTGLAGAAGLVGAAAFLPSGLVGPIGGALADRYPGRFLMITATLVQTALAGLLTVLAALHEADVWAVVVIVFVSGCANAIVLPAYQATLPELVPRKELPSAVALGALQYNLGRVIGPALAGIVIAAGGYQMAFAINTVSFLAVIAAVAPLSLPRPTPVEGESIPTAIHEGLRYALGEPGIRAAMTYLAAVAFLAAPFIALVPAVALKVFHEEDLGTSVLVSAQGIGAVTLALALADLVYRFSRRRVLLTLMTGLPFALLLYALAPSLGLAAVAIFLVGACYLGCISSFMAIAQLRAPMQFRGRIMSTFMLLLGTLYPIGALMQGAIADEVGLRETTATAAVLLALALAALHFLRPGFDAELGDPVEAMGHAEEPLATPIG
jgi:MFS family permease